MAPPEAITLICVAPRRRFCAGGAAHLVGAVAERGQRDRPGIESCGASAKRGRQSPWPPVCEIGPPLGRMRGPRIRAVLDRLREAAVDAAGVADGGEAGVQRVLDVLLHLHRPDGEGVAVRGADREVNDAEVDVGVHEAGHDGAAVEIDHAGVVAA